MDVGDPLRRQLRADKQTNGDVVLRWPRGFLLPSQDEVNRIYAVTNDTRILHQHEVVLEGSSDVVLPEVLKVTHNS